MIDATKKHTYNGKPVRIYADGSDTYGKQIHGAILDRTEWTLCTFNESDLVEVWEPTKGEVCYFWDDGKNKNLIVAKLLFCGKGLYKAESGFTFDNCAPFTGILPEAFKGLR